MVEVDLQERQEDIKSGHAGSGRRERRRPSGPSAREAGESRSGPQRPRRRRRHSPTVADYAMTGVSGQENVLFCSKPELR